MGTTVFTTAKHLPQQLCQIDPVYDILFPGYLELFLDAFVKLRKVTIIFVILSVCPYGTPRLPMDGFL